MRRSYLAALLAAVMALSLIPVAAFASGTPELTQEQAMGLLSAAPGALPDTDKEVPPLPEQDPAQAGADPTALVGSLSAPEGGSAALSTWDASPAALFALSEEEEEAAAPLFADMGDVVLTFTIVPGTPDTVTITGCEGTVVGSFTVPQEVTVDGVSYPVTAIGTRAFAEQRQLTQVWLPNTIQTIGLRAFYNCDHLVAACTYDLVGGAPQADRLFALPDDLLHLEMSAFFGCTRLVSVIIPAGLTRIDACAFSYCYSLGQNVTDAAGNTYGVYFDPGSRLDTIQQEAFANCIMLENITLPESLRTIELRAFYRCAGQRGDGTNTGLKSLVLPNGLQYLGEEAFSQCMSLETVSLPQSLTTISTKAFFSCINLKSGHFRGEGLKNMGVLAFGYCYALKGLTVEGRSGYTLPSTLTALPKWAFSNCLALENIVLPEGLETIGEYAFTDSGITAVTFPKSLSHIRLLAFEGCDRLGSITWADRPAGSPLLAEEKAFAGCQALTSVTLPQLAEGSGSDLFYNCDSLTSVTLASGVTRVPSAAFRDCDRLSSVDLGNSLQTIGAQAFYSCPALTQITLPPTLTTIGALSFNRTGLTQVTIPASVATIGLYPFGNNRAFRSFAVEPNNAGGYYAEDGVLFRRAQVENIEAVVLCSYPAGKSDVSVYAVPKGVVVLDHYAFTWNETLTEITFPDSLKVVGDYVFSDCIKLRTANLSDEVKVGNAPFLGCSMLTQLTLNEDVTKITTEVLPADSQLTSVTVPASATAIENINPFQYLAFLEEIRVAQGNGSFQAVDGVLYSLDGTTLIAYPPNKPGDTFVIPESVQRIENFAFSQNNCLQHIIVPETVQTIGLSAFYGISPNARVDFYREDAQFGAGKEYSRPFGTPSGVTSHLQVNLTHDPNDADGLASYIRSFYTSCGDNNPVPLNNIQAGYFKTPAKTGDKFVVDGVIYALSGENSVTVAQNPSYDRESVLIPASVTYEGVRYTVSGVAANAFTGSALQRNAGLNQATVLIDQSLVGANAFGGAQVTYRAELTALEAQETDLTYGDTLLVSAPASVTDGATVTLRSGSFTATAKANGGAVSFPVNAALVDALGFGSPASVTLSAAGTESSVTLTLHPKTLTVQDLPKNSASNPTNILRLVRPYDGTALLDYTDADLLGDFPSFGDDLALRVTGTLKSAEAAPNMFYQVNSPALTLVGEAAKYYAVGSDINLSTHLTVAVGYGQLYIKEVDGVLQKPSFQRVFTSADGMRVADCNLSGGQFVAYLPTVENGAVTGYREVDVLHGSIVYDEVNQYPALSSFEEQGVVQNRLYRWYFQPDSQVVDGLDLANFRFTGTVKLWDTTVEKSQNTLIGQAGENPPLPAYVEKQAPVEILEPSLTTGAPPAAPADDPPELDTTPGDGTDEEPETPTETPSEAPEESPTTEPSESPSTEPSESPSEGPSESPSTEPSESPSGDPSEAPGEDPSESPSVKPSESPSAEPSETPSGDPSESPSTEPSGSPSGDPSETPSGDPSETPSEEPSESPSASPSPSPSATPTKKPTTTRPSTSSSSNRTPTASPTEEKVSVSDSAAKDAVGSVKQGTVTLEPKISAGNNALISLPLNALSQAITVKGNRVQQVTVAAPQASVSLSRDALESLVKQADGKGVTLRVAKLTENELPSAAKNSLKSRPVYNLTFQTTKGDEISSFGGGLVTISIPYTLASGEVASSITPVWVKDNGETQPVSASAWQGGKLVFETRHLSTYAIADKPTTFPDTVDHWASDDISYVASRNLLIGAGKYSYLPDGPVTWKMAITVLGRLDGVEPDPSATWYDPYLAWGDETYLLPYAQDVNAPIQRQEMAKLVTGFLALHGRSFTKGTIFPSYYPDRRAIGSRYIADVGYLLEMRVMKGHTDGTFDPQSPLTRAQFATMLRRLVELELDLTVK